MEENMILNESMDTANETETTHEEIIQEELPKIQPRKTKNQFKEKECKVIRYNKLTKTLDISFDGYGIRVKNVKDFSGDLVTIRYKGEIGKPNFEYKI